MQKKLDELERKFLNQDGDGSEDAYIWQLGEHMTHTYFLDSIESVRPAWQAYLDMVLVVLTVCFITGGLLILRDKGIISDFHSNYQQV